MDEFYITYLRFILALIFVLGLILFAGWLIRRFFSGNRMLGSFGRQNRRLAIIESLPLDNRRRLILVRRDGKQHLLLVGGPTDMIIEQGIDFLSMTEDVLAASSRISVPKDMAS